MPSIAPDALRRSIGRLKALRDSLPDWRHLPDSHVEDYDTILRPLLDAGADLNDLQVPREHLRLIRTGGNARTGEVRYSENRFIERPFYLESLDPKIAAPTRPADRFGGVTITGSNVTFGDGSHINIASITVGDILRALEAESSSIGDPEQQKSFRSRISELLKHPAATTILQTGLPELLRRLSSSSSMPGV